MAGIEGKVVVITGGARGIGFATAEVLISRGVRVAIGDIDEVQLEAARAQLGHKVLALPLDVTSTASFERFLAAIEEQLGPVDVLVNNAGIMPIGPTIEESEATARRILEINLLGVIIGTKLALKSMLPRRRGHIVNVSSTAGEGYPPGAATYCASKIGVIGFTDSVRVEHLGKGIELSLIIPAFTNTDLISGTKGLRGVATLEPMDVAKAILETIESPTRRSYVPKVVGRLTAILRFLPPTVGEAIGRAMGVDETFLDIDAERRAAYDRRAKSAGS